MPHSIEARGDCVNAEVQAGFIWEPTKEGHMPKSLSPGFGDRWGGVRARIILTLVEGALHETRSPILEH